MLFGGIDQDLVNLPVGRQMHDIGKLARPPIDKISCVGCNSPILVRCGTNLIVGGFQIGYNSGMQELSKLSIEQVVELVAELRLLLDLRPGFFDIVLQGGSIAQHLKHSIHMLVNGIGHSILKSLFCLHRSISCKKAFALDFVPEILIRFGDVSVDGLNQ